MTKKETTLAKLVRGEKVNTEQTTPPEQTIEQTTLTCFVVCKAGKGSIIDYSTDTLIRVTEGQTVELTSDCIKGLLGKQTVKLFSSFALPKQFCYVLNVTPKNTALMIARKSNPSRFLVGSYTRDGKDQCLVAERLMSQDKAFDLLTPVFSVKKEANKAFCRVKMAQVDFTEKETKDILNKIQDIMINH